MDFLDTFLRDEFGQLQYAVFVCALVLFAALELVAQRSPKKPSRGRRWPLNYALTVLSIFVVVAIPVSHVYAVDYAHNNGLGLLNTLAVGPAAAFVIGMLFRSFVPWATHLAMHKVPLLWRVHRVHHTDTFLDVSTTVRFHPLEFLIRTPVHILASVAMGVPPVALMLYELVGSAQAIFVHANIRLPNLVERWMQWIIVTPDMHRIHHSSWQPATDSNFGAVLSIWDRLFGTYRQEEASVVTTMQLGLAECQDARAQSLWWLLTLPLKSMRIPDSDNSGQKLGAFGTK